MSERWETVFSPAQSAKLRAWGASRNLESKSDILRAMIAALLGDSFPDDVPPPGGNREGRRPVAGEQVRIVRATRSVADEHGYTERPLREGARGVVEGRTRRGVVVGFAGSGLYDTPVLVRYRDVEIVPFGE